MENIIVALITGGLSVLGVIISNNKSNDKLQTDIQRQLEVSQAVTNTEIKELKKEVEKHNGVLERVFKLETKVSDMKETVNELKEYHK